MRTVAIVAALLAVAAATMVLALRLSRARRAEQLAHAQLDSMVRNAPIGMAFVDRDQRILQINDTLARLDGRPATELIGVRVGDIGDLPDGVTDRVAEVLATGRTLLDVPHVVGRNLRVLAGYYPVRAPDGSITGVGVVARTVAAEQQRDLLLDRVTRIQELTAALASAGTSRDVIDVAVHAMRQAVGARGTSFARLDGENVVVDGAVGYDHDVAAAYERFPVDAAVPIADAVRTGEPVVCATREATLARYPHLRDALGVASRALVAIPLRGESRVLGAVGLTFDEDHDFEGDELAFLVAAVTQCATAYERSLAYEAERAARRAAEAASGRLEYLSEATKVLAESLDPTTTLQRLAELAVPTLGEWCTVHLVEGDLARPVAMASEDPDTTAQVRALSERNPVPIDAPAGLGAVVRTGEPIVLRSVTMDAVRASTDATEVVDLLSRLRSIAIVPMTFRGRVVGTVTLANVSERLLEDADVALAGELAARGAQAVTNAQLFQERTAVASTLQASLLPPSHPLVPGVDIATRFLPAAEGLDVGGDFYDVVRLGTVDDPAPTWALVIGDVRGKGADAAAITGIARATIRATALDERSPAQILQRLNQVLLSAAQDDRFASETLEPQFCTACVITLTPTPDHVDIVTAVGGHPRPYVLRADGTCEQVGALGGLIGVLPFPHIVDVPDVLRPGDALVLYTDGVTERHEGDRFFEEDGLANVLRTCVDSTAVETAVRIEVAARGFVETPPRDDLAILVARIPERAVSGTVARRRLPDGDRAAGIARELVADALRELGAEREVSTATLLASELVTNAIVHGAPPIDIEIATVAEGLRITVCDHDERLPRVRSVTGDDESGRGLYLVEQLATRWGVDSQAIGKRVWFELAVE